MATIMASTTLLSHANLCPPPLSIHKTQRKATFRWSKLRRSRRSQSSDQHLFGPLDDIIDEIKSDIWESPPDYSLHSSTFDWATSLSLPSDTPLPVSCIPSDQPLTVRKNRNSRSSASDSSMGDPWAYSRIRSQDDILNGGAVGRPYTSLPSAYATMSHKPANPSNLAASTIESKNLTAQQALEGVINNAEGDPGASKRRPSLLRLFTNGFPRLRRSESEPSNSRAGDNIDANATATKYGPAVREPSEDDVEAYLIKHVNMKLGPIMEKIARQLPSPTDYRQDVSDGLLTDHTSCMPTTLRTAVKLFSERKLLTDDYQEFSVAIDIEGVLHNAKVLPNTDIDVIYVVDNGYYVTTDCLHKALDAVKGSLCHLNRGDRVALYTTHCTHNVVSGNKPDLLYPIRPLRTDNEKTVREIITSIAHYGTQKWAPPRPNPPMAEVILALMRSLKDQELKPGRTHVILLSPAAHALHNVSKYFPDLFIHRINPATLPYRRTAELQATLCTGSCCKNVFTSNYTSFQPLASHIKQILKNARFERPIGELTDLSIDIRTRSGCELIDYFGSKDTPHLRLGENHTLVARIRVSRNETCAVETESNNPVFSSSLEVESLREELHNTITLGAIKAHVFDLQIYYRNSLHTTNCWNYTETPLLIIRELGGLAFPLDSSLEVYRRQYFNIFSQLATPIAEAKAENILALLDDMVPTKKFIERIAKEIQCHSAIQDYERTHRQRLPLCPGPVDLEASDHEWLVELWDKRNKDRRGVAVDKKEEVTGLIADTNGLEHLQSSDGYI